MSPQHYSLTEQLAPKNSLHFDKTEILSCKEIKLLVKEHIMGLMGIKRFRFEKVIVRWRAIVEVSSCQFASRRKDL